MAPPLGMEELLEDPALRFWYRVKVAPGLPPDYVTFGMVPVRVWREFLYLSGVMG